MLGRMQMMFLSILVAAFALVGWAGAYAAYRLVAER